MPANGLKTQLATNFTGAGIGLLPIESYDALAYGGMNTSIQLWDADLYPAQNATFTGVANAIPNRGANTFSFPGSGTITFAGGGMTFPASIGGTPGLRIGVAATAGVPHVNDFSLGAATDEYLVTTMFSVQGAGDGSERNMAMQADNGSAGGRTQFLVTRHSDGLRLRVAQELIITGFQPITAKVYVVGALISPNPTGQTRTRMFVFNASDNLVAMDGVDYFTTYVAWAAMTSGGTAIGAPYGAGALLPPVNTRVHGMSIERITAVAADPAERFGMQAKRARALVVAGTVA